MRLAVTIFLFLGMFTCELMAAPGQLPSVFVKKAELTQIFDSLDYPARVEAKINASILAESDGVIAKILKPLGTQVKKFEKLIVVQNTDPIYQYAPMQIENVVAGVVSQVFVTEGSRVAKGDKLMQVTDPHHLRVMVEIPGSDLGLIHQGDNAELSQSSSSASSGQALSQTWQMRVKGMSPFVDPSTGTASCELEFKTTKNAKKTKDSKSSGVRSETLPPAGALAKVSFKTGARDGFLVTDSAVFYRGRETFIRVVRDRHAFLQAVKIGKKQFGRVEILGGLKEDDQVVERTSSFISDGEEVKVESQESNPPETKSKTSSKMSSKTTDKV